MLNICAICIIIAIWYLLILLYNTTMTILNLIKKYLNFIFFPTKCAVCNKKNQNYICDDCKNRLNNIFDPKIVDNIKPGLVCMACFEYKNEIRDMIHSFKFKNQKYISSILSDFLSFGIKKVFKNKKIDLITFVPMFLNIQDDLKYNHAKILAESTAKKLNLPFKNCLVKICNNKKQHNLSFYERQKNVKGVYTAAGKFKNKNILICDDIITTGATLFECKNELEGAGARVLCATVAFTALH